jgi:hypothetical protein
MTQAIWTPSLPGKAGGIEAQCYLAAARAEGRLWDIGTGHDLMITEPQKVADALLQVAMA